MKIRENLILHYQHFRNLVVLCLILELQEKKNVHANPHIGLLHRGTEKLKFLILFMNLKKIHSFIVKNFCIV